MERGRVKRARGWRLKDVHPLQVGSHLQEARGDLGRVALTCLRPSGELLRGLVEVGARDEDHAAVLRLLPAGRLEEQAKPARVAVSADENGADEGQGEAFGVVVGKPDDLGHALTVAHRARNADGCERRARRRSMALVYFRSRSFAFARNGWSG